MSSVCNCNSPVVLQVLVLLDVSPDQSMLDEGVAREVINRIQKLRKKVGHVFVEHCSSGNKSDT